jgi:predicted nucleic acid-binding Zn ribbon protein
MTFETIECGPIITNYFDISKKATKLSLLQAKTYVNKLEKILSKRIKGTSFYINDTRDALISFIMDYYPNLDEDEDNIILHNRNILDRIR